MRDPFIAQRSDDDLVEEARRIGNDGGAYEELYRRHENAARNVARHILRSRHDADDVVNESFAGVIAAIGNGAGPRTNFRQYLMACVRNSCKSRRWCGGAISTDPSIMEENGVCFEDPDRLSEQGLVASAFSSLSPDWQLTLWLTAVEERPTSEVAEQLGRRPGAVAALAHRAREAFAEAYLAQHQVRNTSPACAKVSPKLAHFVRGHSGEMDTLVVERHLVNCVPCSSAVAELRDLNASLRTLTGPAPLVGAGLAAASTGAVALLGGVVPLASAGGGAIAAVGGGTVLAKVLVLGALLVPAAAIVSSDTNEAARADVGASATTSSTRPTSTPNDPVGASPVADAATTDAGTTGDDGSLLPSSAAAGDTGAALSGLDAVDAGGPVGSALTPVDEALAAATTSPAPLAPGAITASSLPGGLPLSGSSVPPIDVKVPLPGGSGTSGVSAGVGSEGAVIGVDLTVPVLGGGGLIDITAGAAGVGAGIDLSVPLVTVPVDVGVALPSGGTPSVSATVVLAPVTTPPISTPPLAGLPSVTVPSATVLGSIPGVANVPSLPLPISLGPIIGSVLNGVLGGS